MVEHLLGQNSPEVVISLMTNRGHYGGVFDFVREEDRLLLIANVSQVMKKVLPMSNLKGSQETAQECVSEFINFITREASDKCQREGAIAGYRF
ncbi:hypothetical protein L7F22_026267 [Adiantum nelumboides]|nr:hypothetical protein [Adiantum nelumboides]